MTKTSACDAKIAKPNEEIDRLVEEGENLLKGQIHVTWQQSDIDQADSYESNTNCYLCCALRRMGYAVRSVGGSEASLINGENYSFPDGERSEASPVHDSSIIGKTLILTLDARP